MSTDDEYRSIVERARKLLLPRNRNTWELGKEAHAAASLTPPKLDAFASDLDVAYSTVIKWRNYHKEYPDGVPEGFSYTAAIELAAQVPNVRERQKVMHELTRRYGARVQSEHVRERFGLKTRRLTTDQIEDDSPLASMDTGEAARVVSQVLRTNPSVRRAVLRDDKAVRRAVVEDTETRTALNEEHTELARERTAHMTFHPERDDKNIQALQAADISTKILRMSEIADEIRRLLPDHAPDPATRESYAVKLARVAAKVNDLVTTIRSDVEFETMMHNAGLIGGNS